MKFTFLGTGAGRPTKKRNVSALALEIQNERGWYLFDCGEGTQHQILKAGLSLYKLKSVFITHTHGDHCYGLFGLITSRMLENCDSPLKIYAPKGVREMVESVVDTSFGHLGYELEFVEIYGGFEEEFEKFSLKVLPLIHSVPSYAFYLKEKTKITLDVEKLKKDGLKPGEEYGLLKKGKSVKTESKTFYPEDYLIHRSGKKIIIAGDNAEPDYLGKYLQNLDLLIHEATYTSETFNSLNKKYLHTTAKNLALSAEKFNVKNLIATHISPRFEGDEILSELKKYFKGTVFVADDFDIFIFAKELKKS